MLDSPFFRLVCQSISTFNFLSPINRPSFPSFHRFNTKIPLISARRAPFWAIVMRNISFLYMYLSFIFKLENFTELILFYLTYLFYLPYLPYLSTLPLQSCFPITYLSLSLWKSQRHKHNNNNNKCPSYEKTIYIPT